jgi:hypothetical protein
MHKFWQITMKQGSDPLTAKWRRFRKLSPEEQKMVLRAMVLLPLTRIGLRAMGFRRWKGLIERFSLPARQPRILEAPVQFEVAGRIARAVRSVELHGLGTPTCLERSMALWWLLRCDGIEGELHIGARKRESCLEAHAWVELAGQALNGSADVHTHYARFDAPIAAAKVDIH